MPTAGEHIAKTLDTIKSRWSLYLHAATLLAAFSLPAWAVRAANVFSQYRPISWVIAGFAGVVTWAIARLIWNWAYRIRISAKYDARFIERGGNYNPLDLIFERRRSIWVISCFRLTHTLMGRRLLIVTSLARQTYIGSTETKRSQFDRLLLMRFVCIQTQNLITDLFSQIAFSGTAHSNGLLFLPVPNISQYGRATPV